MSSENGRSWSSLSVAVLDLDLEQGAGIGVERGFPELGGVHFAQALVGAVRVGRSPRPHRNPTLEVGSDNGHADYGR